MSSDLVSIREKIRRSGLKATASRIATWAVLANHAEPMSHHEIASQLELKGFDRASVYRNLMDFVRVGLAKRTDVGDHVWRFILIGLATDPQSHLHPHFVCNDCGGIECLPRSAVVFRAPKGRAQEFNRNKVDIHLRGLCRACA